MRILKLEEDKYESSLCCGCDLGKFDRKALRSSGRHCSGPRERIHIDIKGPMALSAIGKYKYFLILVDEYSGFTKAFPLINKSEALQSYIPLCEHSWNLLKKRVT